MYLVVTEEHVNKGLPGRSAYCPVALAFKDKGFEHASTAASHTCIYNIYTGEMEQRFQHSKTLKKMVDRFDRLGKFKAGKYVVKEVCPCI